MFSGTAAGQTPEAGSLLVAADELRDPRFSETVILILHYASDGALGVAINRPTWVGAAEAFPDMPFLGGYAGEIFFGGPLAPANLVTLVRIPDIGDHELQPVVDDIYVSADPDFLDELVDTAATAENLRVYAGHVGWDAGQLESEIAAGSWQVLPADAELIFTTEPQALWSELRRPETELMVYRPKNTARTASLR
jgi:putative transcriptional regulator